MNETIQNDTSAFVSTLSSLDQDCFATIMQALTMQTAPGAIDAMEAELEKVKDEIARANGERERIHREQDRVNKILTALNAQIEKKPQSVELRLLRLVLSQRVSKLEEEIGVKRPYKSFQRKNALKREIDYAKQLAEIAALVAVAGGRVKHGTQ